MKLNELFDRIYDAVPEEVRREVNEKMDRMLEEQTEFLERLKYFSQNCENRE